MCLSWGDGRGGTTQARPWWFQQRIPFVNWQKKLSCECCEPSASKVTSQESQNCWCWKEPLEIISSTPPSQAGQPEQAAQIFRVRVQVHPRMGAPQTLWTTWFSLLLPIRYLCTLIRSPLSLLFSILNEWCSHLPHPLLKYQIPQSLNHFSGPSLEWLQYAHIFLLLRIPKLDAELWMCLTCVE